MVARVDLGKEKNTVGFWGGKVDVELFFLAGRNLKKIFGTNIRKDKMSPPTAYPFSRPRQRGGGYASTKFEKQKLKKKTSRVVKNSS